MREEFKELLILIILQREPFSFLCLLLLLSLNMPLLVNLRRILVVEATPSCSALEDGCKIPHIIPHERMRRAEL